MLTAIKQKAQTAKETAQNRWAAAKVATVVGLGTIASGAYAGPFDDIMDGIDLGSVATKIVAMGLIVVGIYLAMQGISVAKRVISKV